MEEKGGNERAKERKGEIRKTPEAIHPAEVHTDWCIGSFQVLVGQRSQLLRYTAHLVFLGNVRNFVRLSRLHIFALLNDFKPFAFCFRNNENAICQRQPHFRDL